LHALQYCMVYLVEVRFLFFSSVMTVLVLICKTRAVSPGPFSFRIQYQ